MNIFFILTRFCHICILTSVANTYVLFAANIEDFRNIAKKFVPGKLADQIAQIASRSAGKPRQNPHNTDEEIYDTRSLNNREDLPNYNGDDPKKTRFSIKEQSAINIDEIVEKVKEKLEKDFHKKYEANLTALQRILEENRNKKKGDDGQIDYNQDYIPKELSRPKQVRPKAPRPKVGGGTSKFNRKRPPRPREDDIDDTKTFSRVKIGKEKDSYEDYVIPEKDDDYSEPSENPSMQNAERNFDSVKKPKLNPNTNRQRYDDSIGIKTKSNQDRVSERDVDSFGIAPKYNQDRFKDIPNKSKFNQDEFIARDDYPAGNNKHNSEINFDNVKAQTENLFYEDFASESTKRAVKNTMIPTKRFFRFSSPNYYVQLPTVVEKYDFNEPIPERDREKEDLKHIPNPPANINGKIHV